MTRDAIYILGVPNFANYESAAALVEVPRAGGDLRYVTISEDRLTRLKHTYTFPLRGIDYCLREMGLDGLGDVDWIVTDYARLPRWHDSGPAYRKLEHDYLKLKLNFPLERILIFDHHDAHAAGAFFPSGYDEAAVLVIDGMGSDLETQSLYHGRGNRLELLERGYDWGVGKLYSIVTGSVLPYGPEKGFGKVMGLAPYGRAHPGPVLEFGARDRGLTTDYSAFCSRQPVSRLVASGVRKCEDRTAVLDPYFARAAFDVQEECERQVLRMARYALERTGCRRLCISGGVALNGRTNHLVLEQTPIEHVWVPPGCSDAGVPLGLALWGAFQGIAGMPGRLRVRMDDAYTGRNVGDAEVADALAAAGVTARETSAADVAARLADGQVVAWFDGASEHGPRALGHRSLLADPRSNRAKDHLNQTVKRREGYRPYAPSVLEEHAREWFDLRAPSPFMLMVCDVRPEKRALVPAITHVDGTARVQEVSRAHSPRYWELIDAFRARTGVPMLLNTSLNVNREPIVETPIDAMICAFGTAIDVLVFNGTRLVECAPHRDPERVQRLVDARRAADERLMADLHRRYLTGYDTEERERFLAAGNARADWYGPHAARLALERFVLASRLAERRVVIVGTPGHTQRIHEHVPDVARLRVVACVPVEHGPGEPGHWPAEWPVRAFDAIDWTGVDAVLVSTHEYQREALERLSTVSGAPAPDVLYDSAMDSLYFTLADTPLVRPARSVAIDTHEAAEAIEEVDLTRQARKNPLDERYAFILNYHFVRPRDRAERDGVPACTPEDLRAHLAGLADNFTFVTLGELLDPARSLPESVALVTFDDALKDVFEWAAPVLRSFGCRATVFLASWPYVEHAPTLTQVRQLLHGRLGVKALQAAVAPRLAARRFTREPIDPQVLANAYPYDDPETRRFKLDLNYAVPIDVLEDVLRTLFAEVVGDPADAVRQLYLSVDELRRLQDAGWEIGGHGHCHQALARLSVEDQRNDIAQNLHFLTTTFGARPSTFAYPFGGAGTWSQETPRVLEQAGYRAAVTMGRDIVRPRDLRAKYTIPRFDYVDLFGRDNILRHVKIEALSTGD